MANLCADPNQDLISEIDKACGNGGFAGSRAATDFSVADDLRIGCGLPVFTQPLPLPERKASPIYPVDALGPLLGEAAKRLAYHVHVPLGMASQSVLAAASLVAQSHVTVARGQIGAGPVSLFFLTVADSGDRKSSVDKLALLPVREYEAGRRDLAKEDLQQYKGAVDAWQLRRDSIVKAAAGGGGKAAISESQQQQLTNELANHEGTKPQPPENSNITFEEPTAEGIWRHYQYGLPSAGLFSDEGVAFFNGHGMSAEARGRTIATMSQLWDGKPITRTRAAEGESGVMSGRYLATHLMVQPVVSAQVLADPMLLGQGFLARFLVCHEGTLAGRRFLFDRSEGESARKDPAIQCYWQRLSRALAKPMPTDTKTGELMPHRLEIKGDAYQSWAELHDSIEGRLREGGAYVDIKAFASKAAENAARIAAVLAFTEHQADAGASDSDCVITVDHIERAGVLIAYYLDSMSLRTSEAQHDKEAVAASELLEWINNRGGSLTAGDFKGLPSVFRSAKKARSLLGLLVSMGHLEVLSYGGNSNKPKPNGWGVISHA